MPFNLAFILTAITVAVSTAILLSPASEALPQAPEGVTIERDVAYLTPDRAEKLDLYLPSHRLAGVKAPGIVIIHGGGWVGGSKSANREFEI